MRHFAGVLLGIVLLPAFFALNWAVNYTDAHVTAGEGRWWLVALLGSYAVLGVLAGICLAWRSISPTALLVGGVLIVVAEVFLALPGLASYQVNLPQLYQHDNVTAGHFLVAVGIALFLGGLLPTRWHRPGPRAASEAEDELAAEDGEYTDDRGYVAELLEEHRAGYDTSWGSGRNEYADEPEQPYATYHAPRQQEDPAEDPPAVTQPTPTERERESP